MQNQAVPVSTSFFHDHHPSIQQKFILVRNSLHSLAQAFIPYSQFHLLLQTPHTLGEKEEFPSSSFVDSVCDAINVVSAGAGAAAGHGAAAATADCAAGGTMVFLNTANRAAAFAAALRAKNFNVAEFHSRLSADEKERSLATFADGESDILVCTDSAARGFDFRRVNHVIQADFALNVVQHLHRIGRASRAGRAGKATNFYSKDVAELVRSILNDEQDQASDGDENRIKNGGSAGKSAIESSFSRRRGFRRKLKRR